MKSATEEITHCIGDAIGDGFFAGRIRIDGQVFAIVVAPKLQGQRNDTTWNISSKSVEGAMSYCDGMANTQAMAEAGSRLAQWALDLRIGGHNDWYLPSQDELEIIYRNLKPTAEQNWCYARSGINLSAVEPTRPYTLDFPLQTQAPLFKEACAEAFDPAWYWSSTQHISLPVYAWDQCFLNGNQDFYHNTDDLRARVVRRIAI
ncbi:MAG: DUF1566 domain-containing protein [Sterolibacterium sp.]